MPAETGKFGPNGEGGWWATRWSFDGIEGAGTGLTEREALAAAAAHIEEQRQARFEAKRLELAAEVEAQLQQGNEVPELVLAVVIGAEVA